MADQAPVDVVTVGGGWTSAILGWKLGRRGHSVVALEQGSARWADPDFQHDHDELRYAARLAMMVDTKRETWTWRPNPDAPALPIRQLGSFHPGAGIGGAGVHWSAQLWRFAPTDFTYRTHHLERYGAAALPEGSRVQDWGLTYDDLEPYYDAFEYDIGTSGVAGNLKGRLTGEGNRFEGARRRPYPLPPLTLPVWADRFADGARALGHQPFPQPAGILSRGYVDATGRPRSACLYCGFCTRYGCEVDAKSSPVTTHLPLALATGRYELRTGARVLRVEIGRDGLARGVTYRDADGRLQFQPAAVVVLSGYTMTNVRMLLLSKSDHHPQGIGNDRGLVGTNFTYQLFGTPVKARYPGQRLNQYMGNTSTTAILTEWCSDNFDHTGLGFIGGAFLFTQSGERGPLRSVDDLALDGSKYGAKWKAALREWDSIGTVAVQGESLPYDDQLMDVDPTYKDEEGLPLLRLTFDWHDNDRAQYRYLADRAAEVVQATDPGEMKLKDSLDPFDVKHYKTTHITGGAIVGRDPGHSVCTTYGQVWDTPNVFVTGAALFPQNSAYNPTGTLGALAYRTGDAMARRYFRHPGELMDVT